jgi:hypothetical protein
MPAAWSSAPPAASVPRRTYSVPTVANGVGGEIAGVPGRIGDEAGLESQSSSAAHLYPADTIGGSTGGFRGLALQAASSGGGARPIPVRLERESRVPTDLSLDALDSRIAESLARILEREARRHGIDTAEVRV